MACLRAFIKPPASDMMPPGTRFSWGVGACLASWANWWAPKTPTFFGGRTIATRCLRQPAFLGLDGRLVRIVDHEVRDFASASHLSEFVSLFRWGSGREVTNGDGYNWNSQFQIGPPKTPEVIPGNREACCPGHSLTSRVRRFLIKYLDLVRSS